MFFKTILAATCFFVTPCSNDQNIFVNRVSVYKHISINEYHSVNDSILNNETVVLKQDTVIFKKELFITESDILPYRIMFPENYDSKKRYPLVVFLHGSGEAGNDNEAQLVHGSKLFMEDSNRIKFPAIVIFPQCPLKSWWGYYSSNSDSLNLHKPALAELLVKALIDSLVANKIVDKKRLYLGGLSMGGYGTYDMAIQYPHYFAALFPICGMANKQQYIKENKNTPIWIFHGEVDGAVDVQPDRSLYVALKKAGAKDVRYSEYKSVNHNCWDNAFSEPDLLEWIFSKHL